MFRWGSTARELTGSRSTAQKCSRPISLAVYLGVACNPTCQKALDRLHRCPLRRRCPALSLDMDAAVCSAPARGCCWLLMQPEELYDLALELSRSRDYMRARTAFEVLLQERPSLCKAWVSYAQMEKRSRGLRNPESFDRCRQVLQRGLQLNPDSACLAQAWGLMELQRGNIMAAVLLLERCVRMDPACSPVLRWKEVQQARHTVGQRRGLRRQRQGLQSS